MSCDFRGLLLEGVGRESGGNDDGGLCLFVFSHSIMSVILWTVAHQALLSMEFSRQEYWSGWPFPPPGDLPHPGIEPASLVSHALAG